MVTNTRIISIVSKPIVGTSVGFTGKLKWPLFPWFNIFFVLQKVIKGDYFSTRRKGATVLKFCIQA